jgi:hypothetical protein
MIKHIVMFKLAEKNQANIGKAVTALNSLKDNIETLRFLEVGVDYFGSDRSYDIILITHFDNNDGLETYRQHKNHLPIVKIMKELCSSSVSIDYEPKNSDRNYR